MITMVFPYDGHHRHHYQCVVGAWLDAPPRHTGSVYFSRGILGWWRIHGLRTDQPPTTRRLLRTRPECICWQALIPFTQCLIVVYRNIQPKKPTFNHPTTERRVRARLWVFSRLPLGWLFLLADVDYWIFPM